MDKLGLISILLTAIGSLSGFSFWLVKKIIAVTESVNNSVNELKSSVEKNNLLLDHFLRK